MWGGYIVFQKCYKILEQSVHRSQMNAEREEDREGVSAHSEILPGHEIGPLVISQLSLSYCKDVLTGFPREHEAEGPWVETLHSLESLRMALRWATLKYPEWRVPCSSFCSGHNSTRETSGGLGHGSGVANQIPYNDNIWQSCRLSEKICY